MSKALIVVDVQRDFCEGGALAVNGGHEVALRIYDHVVNHKDEYDAFAFTKDWHKAPPDTNGGHFSDTPDFVDSWPVHCVAETPMSDFEYGVKLAFTHLRWEKNIGHSNIFFKGHGQPDYSGFQGKNEHLVSLHQFLVEKSITDLVVVGIAGDHCVRATALDGVRLGYHVTVLPDLVASVGGDAATEMMLQEVDNAQRGW